MDLNFNGVWGKMREDFLREKKPEFYKSLKSSGKLYSYLEDFQNEYSRRAEVLTKKMKLEYGIDEKSLQNDSIGWLTDSMKIFLVVREKLKAEIQK